MKRTVATVLMILVGLVLFVGCDALVPTSGWDSGPDNLEEVVSDLASNEGVIRFEIPAPLIAKTIDNVWASNTADTYAVYIYNSNGFITGKIFSDGGGALNIAVPEETYEVVVVAGRRFNTLTESGAVYMLGNAGQSDVTVTSGQTTTLNITLATIPLSMTGPATAVDTGSVYEVIVQYDLNLWNLAPQGGYFGGVKITEDEVNFGEIIDPSTDPAKTFQTGTVFTSTYTITAPAIMPTGEQSIIWWCGPAVKISDVTAGWTNYTLNNDGLEWYLPMNPTQLGYRIDYPDDMMRVIVPLSLADGGMDVTAGW